MTPRFSRRTETHGGENLLSKILREVGARRAVLDLTVSNPTTCGLPYAEREIAAALSDPRALRHEPTALGARSAREAICAFYMEEWGLDVDPDRVVLTCSTSEAYAALFKILCDPGDSVLVPEPSYPLLEHLAGFESVQRTPYALAYDGAWHVDLPGLRAAVGETARAIVTVNPNNPTGSYLTRGELLAMGSLGLPLISDEVFAAYPLRDGPDRIVSVCDARDGLAFALSGLSKLVALPQMKLAWIIAAGADAAVREAISRLELVSDAYLSVNTPVAVALPRLLAAGARTREAIRLRTLENLEVLRRRTQGRAVTALDVEGGWYAILQVPSTRSETAWACALLAEHAVYTHPGHFFDMRREAFLVISLLTPADVFAEGVDRLLSYVDGAC